MEKHKKKPNSKNKEFISKMLNALETTLFVVVFTVLCIMLYSLHKYQSVSLFNYKFLRIVSDSMEPTFASGSCIVVKKTDASKLKVGDIITFISHDDRIYEKYNTHRIYEIVNDNKGDTEFRTKGDKFSSPDDKMVYKQDIIGKFVCKVPFSKAINFLIIKLSNSMVYFVIIIIPLIFCLLSYIKQLMKIIVFGDMNYKKKKSNTVNEMKDKRKDKKKDKRKDNKKNIKIDKKNIKIDKKKYKDR